MTILKGLKWLSEKNLEAKNFRAIVSIDFLYFIFLFMIIQKGTKGITENEKNSLFQKYFHQMYYMFCKFSTNVAKIFVNNFLIFRLFEKNLQGYR